MPSAILRLTVPQFTTLLQSAAASLTRKIDAVHLHHTWRPTRAQFKGQATIEAMRNYHINTNKWSDIAQHLSIDPQGMLWTGRNWNAPPASQAGRNGTANAGPFMIEIIGDFDHGRDVLDGAQRRSVVEVVAALLGTFGLDGAAVYFHRELGSPKSCPGTSVDKKTLVSEIEAARTPPATAPKSRGTAARVRTDSAPLPFDSRYVLGHELTLPVDAPLQGYESFEIPEHQHAIDTIRERSRAQVAADLGSRELQIALARFGQWDALRPYVVNLTKGRLSQSGEFEMPDGSIEAIIDKIRQYATVTPQPRLMLHAHGGLVSEKSALQYAQGAHQWWLEHGIYPIYFIWETHLFEILKQRLGLARGLDDVRDFMFEQTARAAGGKIVWSDMKESARLASNVDAGGGETGGARIFAEALAADPVTKTIEVHAVGHSAGAILHSHLLPVLLERGLTLQSLALLAPAVRIDLFRQLLLTPIKQNDIKSFSIFTMDEEAERDDDLVEPLGITLYGKSLLYLVSRAFEPKRKTPLLGLHELLKDDSEVMKLFDGNGGLQLARARGKPQNEQTRAKQHGCFDNEAATMASVFRRIANIEPSRPFPLATAECSEGGSRSQRLLVPTSTIAPPLPSFPSGGPAQTAGNRRALCIGVNTYRDSPLLGCVSDATAWASVLGRLQFDVKTLFDAAATRQGVLDALRALIESARPGDMLVFQYSGHGTQVEDLNGDETDRYDEALVPVDYHTGALLLDDDLADVYRSLPNGAVLTLFMDCCHSGTNSRFAPLDRNRPRGTERRRYLELPADVRAAHRAFRARFGSPAPTSAEESLPGIIHFAACLDNQFAYESNSQGHFTLAATQALDAAVSTKVTNEAFSMAVAAKVMAIGQPQTPKLMRLPESLANRAILTAVDAAALSSERI